MYLPALVVAFLGTASFFAAAAPCVGRPRFDVGASSASSSALRFIVVLAVVGAALATVVVAFLGGISMGVMVAESKVKRLMSCTGKMRGY